MGDDTHDHALRAWLRGRGRAAHVDAVHLVVKRPVWVVREFCGTRDGGVVGAVAGVVRAADGEAVDEQVHSGVAAHVEASCGGP